MVINKITDVLDYKVKEEYVITNYVDKVRIVGNLYIVGSYSRCVENIYFSEYVTTLEEAKDIIYNFRQKVIEYISLMYRNNDVYNDICKYIEELDT